MKSESEYAWHSISLAHAASPLAFVRPYLQLQPERRLGVQSCPFLPLL